MLPILVPFVIVLIGLAIASELVVAAKGPDVDPRRSLEDYGGRGLPLVMRGLAVFAVALLAGAVLGRQIPALLAGAVAIFLVYTAMGSAFPFGVEGEWQPDDQQVSDRWGQPDRYLDLGFVMPDGHYASWEEAKTAAPPGSDPGEWVFVNLRQVSRVLTGTHVTEVELRERPFVTVLRPDREVEMPAPSSVWAASGHHQGCPCETSNDHDAQEERLPDLDLGQGATCHLDAGSGRPDPWRTVGVSPGGRMPTFRSRILFAPLLAVCLISGSLATAVAQDPSGASPVPGTGGPVQGTPPTKGPMPADVGVPVPDFIPVAERMGDGIAGYIAVIDMPSEGSHPWWYQEPPIPVYADDLQTLVGFMFAGKGFVALGVDPRTVPDFDGVPGPSTAP
ncbi:MAG: hypothetical protein LH650_12835 [Chloroflexi bacterium]|nr:hypothetical protein [Chloroflexota bacterium]